jgi:hypothetical protein
MSSNELDAIAFAASRCKCIAQPNLFDGFLPRAGNNVRPEFRLLPGTNTLKLKHPVCEGQRHQKRLFPHA